MSTSKIDKNTIAKTKVAKKQPYHHGGLREALVDAGLAILAEGGDPAAFSLREAARRAGVSAMAPYRHFPDKDALLAAVAAVGFARLEALLEVADAGAASGGELIAQGQAYFDFAVAGPALFRLMFGAWPAKEPPKDSTDGGPADDAPAFTGGAFAVMARRVATVAAPEERANVALHCWALVHGLAALALDGKFGKEAASVRAMVPAVLAITVRGLAPRSERDG